MAKKDIAAALTETLEETLSVQEPDEETYAIQKAAGAAEPIDKIIRDTEDDVAFARKQLKRLIEENNEAISQIRNLAGDTEHPRAFEVLGQLLKQAADMNKQLIELQKQRKDIVIPKKGGDAPMGGNVNQGTVNNTTVFVGTTAELQKIVQDQIKTPQIDIDV